MGTRGLRAQDSLGGPLETLTVMRIGHFSPLEPVLARLLRPQAAFWRPRRAPGRPLGPKMSSRQAPWSPRLASDQALCAHDVHFHAPSEVQDPPGCPRRSPDRSPGTQDPGLPENDTTSFMIEVRRQMNRHFFPDQICVATRSTSNRRYLSTGSR